MVLGYPNFFGVIEDLRAVHARWRATRGALLVTATAEPLALACSSRRARCGADIAVGEGQSLGVPMSYGGPGVGLFATRIELRAQHARPPGRRGVDDDGRRGYVLTLATREQHIRREKATSNICTNHGLIALAVTVYLSLLGKHGLRALARLNLARAHRAASGCAPAGAGASASPAPFFNEFVVARRGRGRRAGRGARSAASSPALPLGRWYPELDDALLIVRHRDARRRGDMRPARGERCR